MLDFTIFNVMDRIKEQGDIFKGVLGKGIDLKKVMKNIDSLFGGG
jgi:bifunctional non-homologous end joining protein LigD